MGSFSLFSLFYDHVLTTCQATTPAAHFLGRPTFADLPFAMRMLWAGYVAGHYKQARMYSHFRWVMGKSDHPLATRALHLGACGGLRSAGVSHTTLQHTWQRAHLGLPAPRCDSVKPVGPTKNGKISRPEPSIQWSQRWFYIGFRYFLATARK